MDESSSSSQGVASPPATLYVDFLSQPSRALLILKRIGNLPLREQVIQIGRGDTRKPSFLKNVNGLGKVPVILFPDGSSLFETQALVRYLWTRYPNELPAVPWHTSSRAESAALHDAALAFWLGTIRAAAAPLVFTSVLSPRLGLGKSSPDVIVHYERALQGALRDLETVWLEKGDPNRPFMLPGAHAPSVADVLVACELEGLRLLGAGETRTATACGGFLDPALAPYPAVRAWLCRVQRQLDPVYSEVHSLLLRAAGTFSTGSARSKL